MQSLITQNAAVEITIQTVLDSLDSAHSRRAYERHLREFIAWHHTTGQFELNKATVQRYAAELRHSGLSPATINQRLSAIRKLAAEASDNGALEAQIASGIKAVKGLARCRQLLGASEQTFDWRCRDYQSLYQTVSGTSLHQCPACRTGTMKLLSSLVPLSAIVFPAIDSS